MNTLTRDIAGDRRVLALARDLVNFIYIYDAHLGTLHIKIGSLQQLEQNVLNVFTYIASLGQCGCVGNSKWNIEQSGECLSHVCLAATCWSEQQDVALLQFDFVATSIARIFIFNATVVIEHRNGQNFLCLFLANDILIQKCADVAWNWKFF